MTISEHVCCQCSCPVLRDGTQVFGPEHNRMDWAGMGESEESFQARRSEFRAANVPVGTSTRCSVHNAKFERGRNA